MPLPSSTPTKDNKISGVTPCHVGTPTPSLRRGAVKPLGDHNIVKSRTHSPALGYPSVNDSCKRTPVRSQKKTILPGVDLSHKFADGSIHGLTTYRGPADFRSPLGSPSLGPGWFFIAGSREEAGLRSSVQVAVAMG